MKTFAAAIALAAAHTLCAAPLLAQVTTLAADPAIRLTRGTGDSR